MTTDDSPADLTDFLHQKLLFNFLCFPDCLHLKSTRLRRGVKSFSSYYIPFFHAVWWNPRRWKSGNLNFQNSLRRELSTARSRIRYFLIEIFFQVISHRSLRHWLEHLFNFSTLRKKEILFLLRKSQKYISHHTHTRRVRKGEWAGSVELCWMSDSRLGRKGIDKIFVFFRLTRNRLYSISSVLSGRILCRARISRRQSKQSCRSFILHSRNFLPGGWRASSHFQH